MIACVLLNISKNNSGLKGLKKCAGLRVKTTTIFYYAQAITFLFLAEC